MFALAIGIVLAGSAVKGQFLADVASGPMPEPMALAIPVADPDPFYETLSGPFPEPIPLSTGPGLYLGALSGPLPAPIPVAEPYYGSLSGPLAEPIPLRAGPNPFYGEFSGPLPEPLPEATGPDPGFAGIPGLIPGSRIVDVDVIKHAPVVVNEEILVPSCGCGSPYFFG